MEKILLVDDDNAIRKTLSMLLERNGYETIAVENPDKALEIIRSGNLSLIITDMNYSLSTSGEEGLHFLRQIKIFLPDTPVILITAWGSIELAVDGMKAGAFDFITKPWNNRLFLQRVETALNLSKKNSTAENVHASSFNNCGFIGENPIVKDLLRTVEHIAPTDAPVLILGENGTGKELIANAIHANSRRRDNPFVMVNLGGISTSLFESEMFGHAKGAFTGATSDRKGRFEIADRGTIFLDEIGELDVNSQVKLLRVLQQHTFERLGENKSRKTDIRTICATNADLPEMVKDRTFREDLFYRINLITLRIPPLRERRDDIPLIARHFISMVSENYGIPAPDISPEAMEYLSSLSFPGNVRQLKNMIERAVIMCNRKSLEIDDFRHDSGLHDLPGADSPSATLDEMERKAVAKAIANNDGNLSKAARELGITRQSLYRKIEKYHLSGN